MSGKSYYRQKFVDTYIDLTGCMAEHGEFDGCIVVLNKGPPCWVKHNTFKDCQLLGDAWPPGMFTQGDVR